MRGEKGARKQKGLTSKKSAQRKRARSRAP